MPPAPFDLPEELLEVALARLAGEAGQRVDAALADLVAAHPEHAEALRALRQALDGANRLLAQTVATPVPPSIGGHRVERRLGEGAFGTVYLCTQTQPVVRPVAVKVLRPGAGDRHTVRRFEAERQVLASLQHPTITHVYDAGYLPDGRPYFVMEHIDGLPITEYCNAHRLGCEARLRLLVQVCRGVEHAHSRGVVHRDLKPSNVLVVEATGEPLPKIIDFGIAKALAAGDGSDGEGPTTDAGRVLGTPGYMSPEQATARLDQIDERSDVFALGVMLYELLTGELPWPRGEGLGDVTPQLPSRRLRSIPHRSAAATQKAARVRGDLDWITRKATQAAREERYAGVRALADDLERHLAGLPVLAGPPSIAYRLRKLVLRNRVATWALAGAVLASAFGLAIAAWEGRTAEAGVRKATAAAAANFADAAAAVHKLLERAKDPALQQKPQSEGIRAALANDALGFFDQWLATRPQDAALRRKRCEALITLAEVHNLLGQYTDAQQRAEQANAEAQSLFDETPGDVPGRAVLADALRKLHRALVFMGRHADARPLIEAAVAHYEQCAAADAVAHGVSYGRALSELGTLATIQKRTVDAEAAIRSAIAWLEGLVARDITPAEARSDLVRAKFALANVHVRAERWDEAERILLAVEKELDALTEGRLRVTTGMLRQQAIIKTMRGDHAGAVPLLERAVATGETWRQQEPQQALASSMLHSCLQDLAHVYDKLGEFAAGERTMRRIAEVGEERLATLPKGASFAAEQAKALFWFARKLWNRLRHEDLDLATTWLARARELATQTGDPPLWVVEATQALVADARGDADAARWVRVATTMPAAPAPADQRWDSLAAEAWIAVARSRFDRADPGEAAAALERAEQHLDASTDAYVKNYRSEISWWRARLSLTAGDIDGAAPHVARLLELRSSWWGRWRAGDCEREAWQRLAATDPERARAHREAAAGHYRSAIEGLAELVAKDPADPWPVVPWSMAQIGLAETAADRGETSTAVALLDLALPALARVEANAHRDAWDAPRVAAARALRERLVGR